MERLENSLTEVATVSLTYILSITIVFLFAKLLLQSINQRNKHIPRDSRVVPGPIGFPIIGNIPQLGSSKPHVSFVELAKKYGGVFCIRIGNRPVIVLNGRRAIHQALVRQSVDFAGRPDFRGFQTLVAINGGSLAFSTYDEGWKLHRKLAYNALRHFTSGKQSVLVEQRVRFEAIELINFVTKGQGTAIFDPSRMLKLSVSNVMASLLFECRHKLDHEELKSIVNDNDLFIEAISGSNMVDFMPWLETIFPGKMRIFTDLGNKLKELLSIHVDKHIEDYESGLDSDILNYIMTLTETLDPKQKEQFNLTDERIRSVVFDLFGAGFETVASTLMWAFLYVIYFPDLQTQIRKEIDELVGRDRLPSLTDRAKLPLTEAFLAEVFRHSSVVPTTLPHSTVRDTVLAGGYNYFIPKDTVVFVNLYSIHHDSNEWKEPETFDPSRFLSDDGTKLDIDKVDSLMRFGVGRRRCIGSEVAQMEVFLYFSIIIHQCLLRNVEGQKLTLRGTGSLLVEKPPKYHMEIEMRSS